MDWDRIRIFLEVARTGQIARSRRAARRLGMRVNRQHKGVNRASEVNSLFRVEEY